MLLFDQGKTYLTQFFRTGSQRSLTLKRNIAASFGLRGINILISLVLVPMTIHYVNPVQYGLWLTISGMITWLSYFDFGFTNGFRNRFTQAVAQGNTSLAQALVSTTYGTMLLLFGTVCIAFWVANHYITWSTVLHIDTHYDVELTKVFSLMAFFFCYTLVAKTLTTMFDADQRPALTSIIETIGQISIFITIFLLTRLTSGSLLYLAFVISGMPCVVLTGATFLAFSSQRYRAYRPSIHAFNPGLIRSIVGLGGKFFVIMVVMFCITQLINLILTRIQGPASVTVYNVAYRYFNVIQMFMMIIIAPLWSAFADAYCKEDYAWMEHLLYRLERILLGLLLVIGLALCVSPLFFEIWLQGEVQVPFAASAAVCFYIACTCCGSLYMYIINGTSKVLLQLIIYIIFALLSVPAMLIGCRLWGIVGIVAVPSLCFLVQGIIGRIQIKKIIHRRAYGLWNK